MSISKAEYAKDFRSRWESEIRRESSEGYGKDGVLWYLTVGVEGE